MEPFKGLKGSAFHPMPELPKNGSDILYKTLFSGPEPFFASSVINKTQNLLEP
jgi:hypothetical protein